MITTILILILLCVGLLNGLRRGFVLQLLNLVKVIGSLLFAWVFYDQLAPLLANIIPYPKGEDGVFAVISNIFPLESGYYNTIAFIILLIIARILLHFIASFLNIVTHLPGIHTLNRILGAALGFVETYILIFVALYVLIFIPATKDWVSSSGLAIRIINSTPYLSDFLSSIGLI